VKGWFASLPVKEKYGYNPAKYNHLLAGCILTDLKKAIKYLNLIGTKEHK
jgi:hypothetical protein